MEQALSDIEALLRKYGHVYQANLAEIALAHWHDDPVTACRALNSAEWWGEDDAIAAVDLALQGGFSSAARRDGQALRRALISVYEQLAAHGEHHPAGELAVRQFRKWLSSRI